SPVGDLLASTSLDRSVKLWNAKTCEFITDLPRTETEMLSLAFSPTGDELAAGGGRSGKRGEVRFYTIPKGRLLTTHYGISEILTVAFRADGKLAAGGGDGLVRIWDQSQSSEPWVFRGDTQVVFGLSFGPDGTLACAGRSGRIHLYNSGGGQETVVFRSPL